MCTMSKSAVSLHTGLSCAGFSDEAHDTTRFRVHLMNAAGGIIQSWIGLPVKGQHSLNNISDAHLHLLSINLLICRCCKASMTWARTTWIGNVAAGLHWRHPVTSW